MIMQFCGKLCLRRGLLALSAYPRNPYYFGIAAFFGAQSQHGLEQSHFSDRELSSVNADCDSACAGGQIVTGERTLPPFIQLPSGIQCERMSGNDQSRMKLFAQSH